MGLARVRGLLYGAATHFVSHEVGSGQPPGWRRMGGDRAVVVCAGYSLGLGFTLAASRWGEGVLRTGTIRRLHISGSGTSMRRLVATTIGRILTRVGSDCG